MGLRPTNCFDDFENKTKELSGGPILFFVFCLFFFSDDDGPSTRHQKPNTSKVDNVCVYRLAYRAL